MKKAQKIWITEHAGYRFIERVIVQYGKFSTKRFRSLIEIYNFLEKLARKAILKQNRKGELGEDQYRVPWPYPNEPLPDIILVINSKHKVLKTCWPDDSECLNPDVFRLEKENN